MTLAESVEAAIGWGSCIAVAGMLAAVACRLAVFCWIAYRPWTARQNAEFDRWVADGLRAGGFDWRRRRVVEGGKA